VRGLRKKEAMVTLALRLHPETLQDLGWVRQSIDDVHDLYAFLVKAFADEGLGEPTRPMTDGEHDRAVDGVVAQTGMPIIRFRQGSMILELSQVVDATVGVQALLALGFVLKKGPEVAAWPSRVKEAWYCSREDALLARQGFERLRTTSCAEVIEEVPGEDDAVEERAESRPASARPRTRSRTPSSTRQSQT
jgi:hypothetical protein